MALFRCGKNLADGSKSGGTLIGASNGLCIKPRIEESYVTLEHVEAQSIAQEELSLFSAFRHEQRLENAFMHQ